MLKINVRGVLLSLFCAINSNGDNVAMHHLKSDFSQLDERQKGWKMLWSTLSYNIYYKDILQNITSEFIHVEIEKIAQPFELEYLENRIEQTPKSIQRLTMSAIFWPTPFSKDEIIKFLKIGSTDACKKFSSALYSQVGPSGPVSTCYLFSIDNDWLNLYIIYIMTHRGKEKKNLHLSGYEIFHTAIKLNGAQMQMVRRLKLNR